MPTSTTDTTSIFDTPFALPGGATIKNRLVKAAMSEQLASRTGAPTEAHERLYARWARGGAGMLITGNVMIDKRSLGEPRNVVVEDERDLAALRRWATAAKANDTTAIVQINHPGRQSFVGLSSRVVAPSAVPIDYPEPQSRERSPARRSSS
jgi:2,4-dienoyl-CoA reductase-like NADH-dependent reductase (Old Yellow Enzyme family)